jgi:hypothetical protein
LGYDFGIKAVCIPLLLYKQHDMVQIFHLWHVNTLIISK